MKKALAVLLLVLGSFLEVYYYYFRFTQDGTPWQIAVIIGIALNFLLIGAKPSERNGRRPTGNPVRCHWCKVRILAAPRC